MSTPSATPPHLVEWRRYLDKTAPEDMRPVILESWVRSEQAGVERDAPERRPPRVSDEDLAQRLSAASTLIEVARPHLEWLSAHLADVGHVVYITDRDGVVLHALGDPAMQAQFGIAPGYDWSERAMGANGAGTALASDQPVAVVGPEHYRRVFDDCTCTAAPLHLDGQIVGAIDVSTSVADASPGRLVLVSHVAFVIDRELRDREALRRQAHHQELIEALGRAQQDLRASNELFRLVTDKLPVLISYIDAEQRYRLANIAYAHWFGEEVIGRTVADVLGEAAYATAREHLELALSGHEVCFQAHVNYRVAGPRHVAATYIPDWRDGRVSGIVALVQDVTETKRLQDALQDANRRKDEFVATLGHELRNPLSAVRNGLHFMKSPPSAPEKMKATAEMLERQVHRITRLTDDLLDLARIAQGKIELRTQKLRLSDVLARALESSAREIESKGHKLHIHIVDESLLIEADADRLVQVFVNLLSNAAKYTDRQGQISMTLERSADQAMVRVTDTGVGIPAEALPRVFEMFSQAHSADRSGGGLGIGLALVSRIVTLHGGAIEASSAGAGQGSTFTVRLPLAQSG